MILKRALLATELLADAPPLPAGDLAGTRGADSSRPATGSSSTCSIASGATPTASATPSPPGVIHKGAGTTYWVAFPDPWHDTVVGATVNSWFIVARCLDAQDGEACCISKHTPNAHMP